MANKPAKQNKISEKPTKSNTKYVVIYESLLISGDCIIYPKNLSLEHIVSEIIYDELHIWIPYEFGSFFQKQTFNITNPYWGSKITGTIIEEDEGWKLLIKCADKKLLHLLLKNLINSNNIFQMRKISKGSFKLSVYYDNDNLDFEFCQRVDYIKWIKDEKGRKPFVPGEDREKPFQEYIQKPKDLDKMLF